MLCKVTATFRMMDDESNAGDFDRCLKKQG